MRPFFLLVDGHLFIVSSNGFYPVPAQGESSGIPSLRRTPVPVGSGSHPTASFKFRALSPNTFTLGVTAAAHEFWRGGT